MSNVTGSVGVHGVDLGQVKQVGSISPRNLKKIKNSRHLELVEEDGQYYVCSIDSGPDFEPTEKIPVTLEEDEKKKKHPRIWNGAGIWPKKNNIERNEDGQLVPTNPQKHKRKKRQNERSRKKKEKRIKDIGLDLASAFDSSWERDQWLQNRWDGSPPVTRKEIRLLGMKLSEITGIGPFPIDFKSMSSRWASWRPGTERISFRDIKDDSWYKVGNTEARAWAWMVLAHEYAHAVLQREPVRTHGERFKRTEDEILESIGLSVEWAYGHEEAVIDSAGRTVCTQHADSAEGYVQEGEIIEASI